MGGIWPTPGQAWRSPIPTVESHKGGACVLIIGDDITGCNATGIIFKQLGYHVDSITHLDYLGKNYVTDVTVWNSASRTLEEEEAVSRVTRMTREFLQSDYRLLAKRIDSTFRGWIGQEVEAMLTALHQAKSKVAAVMVPAFPKSGRVTRDGQLFVHGVPLHETDIARDPHNPVHTADLINILSAQTNLPIVPVKKEAYADRETFFAKVHQAVTIHGFPLLFLCDAESDEDVSRLAELYADMLAFDILPVDPGPFTYEYFRRMKQPRSRYLVVFGSLMPLAKRQMEYLIEHADAKIVSVDIERMIKTGASYARSLIDQLEGGQSIIGFRTDHHRLDEAIAKTSINQQIHQLVEMALEHFEVKGMFLTGGEIALSVLEKMGVTSLELIEEIEPLCVLGRINDGLYRNMPVITKGGAVGNPTVILKSVQRLKEGVSL